MNRGDCEFEADVLAAVMQSRWPERLRAHLAECEVCADVAAVAGAIESARAEMRPQIAVPEAGRVWWLAQLRARREAAQAAGRPITAAQVVAFACLFAFVGACFGATSAWFQAALTRAQALVPGAAALVAEHSALFLGMAGLLVVVPAALWLAMLRD